MAATASTAARGASAGDTRDSCARCGKRFAGPDDRRAQLRAPDLCRACHLDPRARSLPLETDIGKSWLVRCARTLGQLIVSPSASFRVVEEPVSHARVLAFLATVRLPLWLVALCWAGFEAFVREGPGPLRHPSVIGVLMSNAKFADAQFADVMRLWLLTLVPIGLPMLYFFGGILAHMGMALTGGARRSIGATMRAVGLALAPSLLLVGVADLLAVGLKLEPEIWLGVVSLAASTALVLPAVALARTHSTSVIRGFLVAGMPLVLFAAVTVGRGLLEYSRMPFMPPAELDDSYVPYSIH